MIETGRHIDAARASNSSTRALSCLGAAARSRHANRGAPTSRALGTAGNMGSAAAGPSQTRCSAGASLDYPCAQPFTNASRAASSAPSCWVNRAGCEKRNTPQLVAHCSAGLMRSFVHPLIYKSFKHNYVDAFGGLAATFLLLKTFDVAAKDGRQRFPAEPTDDRIAGWSADAREELRQGALVRGSRRLYD